MNLVTAPQMLFETDTCDSALYKQRRKKPVRGQSLAKLPGRNPFVERCIRLAHRTPHLHDQTDSLAFQNLG